MAITYRELAERINKMDESQKDSDVTIEIEGEFLPVTMYITQETDVLDKNHPVLIAENVSCMYCGGNCPQDENNCCDAYSGDVDGLYDDF